MKKFNITLLGVAAIVMASLLAIGCSFESPLSSQNEVVVQKTTPETIQNNGPEKISGIVSKIEIKERAIGIEGSPIVILVEKDAEIRFGHSLPVKEGDISKIKYGDEIVAIGTFVTKNVMSATRLDVRPRDPNSLSTR